MYSVYRYLKSNVSWIFFLFHQVLGIVRGHSLNDQSMRKHEILNSKVVHKSSCMLNVSGPHLSPPLPPPLKKEEKTYTSRHIISFN